MELIDFAYSTKLLFTESAADYLRGDLHWGCDLDVIVQYANKHQNLSVVELGSGYSWHLANLFFLVSCNLKQVVGVDFSLAMINQARELLLSIQYARESLINRVDLIQANLLNTPLQSNSFNLALMLNNTLGNVIGPTLSSAEGERINALREAWRILTDDGYLILSVYHNPQIEKQFNYKGVFMLDAEMSDFTQNDLVVRYTRTFTPCYSHWFIKEEAHELLINCGFDVLMCENRMHRLIFICKKILK